MAYQYFNSASGLTSDQVFDLLMQLLPRNADALYGLLHKSGDPYNVFAGEADGFKAYCLDAIATARAEVSPLTTTVKLPEYESWTGLTQTIIALTGSTQQRRNQVISKLREQGASTVNNVIAILAPLLGMFPGNVQVVESNQAAITTAHTYTNSTGASIGANSSVSQTVLVNDAGVVSDAGAQVTVTVTSTNPEQLSFTLTTPAGVNAYTMPAGTIPAGSVTSVAFKVSVIPSAGASFTYGTWTFQVNTGAATCTLVSWALFVEGIAQGQDTGGARYWFGVYADPAHLGETGASANFAAARAALARITPAHAVACLLQSISGAYPDTTSGANAAIPNECLPA